MSPDNKIIDLPVQPARAGGRSRRIGPARIIIFPGVRIDRGGADAAARFASLRRMPPQAAAHAVDKDKQ